ncbi:MAG: NAD(P)H-binding protein [Rhodospirillaceae bacterium]
MTRPVSSRFSLTPFLVALCAVFAAPLTTASLTTASLAAEGGVIVFGGAGRTGAFIVDELLAQGEAVTVFVRPTSDRARLAGKEVAYAVGDAMKAADVDAAFAAAKPRVAINAIGGRGTQKNFWDTTQMNITAAAKKHGTEEIIFLSSVGVGDSAMAYSEAARARTKDSMDERYAAEEDLKASGLTYVIIRTGIIAPEGTAPTGLAELTEDRMSMGPVSRADLAEMTVACMGNDACANMTFAAEDKSLTVSRE